MGLIKAVLTATQKGRESGLHHQPQKGKERIKNTDIQQGKPNHGMEKVAKGSKPQDFGSLQRNDKTRAEVELNDHGPVGVKTDPK